MAGLEMTAVRTLMIAKMQLVQKDQLAVTELDRSPVYVHQGALVRTCLCVHVCTVGVWTSPLEQNTCIKAAAS